MMTKKEAIARIKDHMSIHKMHEERAVKITEALNMAISALEQPIRCGECRHKNKDGMCRIFKEYVFNDDYFCCYAVQKEGKK